MTSMATKIAMLLHCHLGCEDGAVKPLSHDEYNLLVKTLVAQKLGLKDLFKGGHPNIELIDSIEKDTAGKTTLEWKGHKDSSANEWSVSPIGERDISLNSERLQLLLSRVAQLRATLESWRKKGITVAGRRDGAYPHQFQDVLGSRKPVLFYFIGDRHLFERSGIIVMGMRADPQYKCILRALAADMALPEISFSRTCDAEFIKAVLATKGRCMEVHLGDLAQLRVSAEMRMAVADGRLGFCSTWEPCRRGTLSQDDELTIVHSCQHGLADYIVEFGVSPDDELMVAPGYVSLDTVDGTGHVWGCPTSLKTFSTIRETFKIMSSEPWNDNDGPCYRSGFLADLKSDIWQKQLDPWLNYVQDGNASRVRQVRYYGSSQNPRSFSSLCRFADDPCDEVRLEFVRGLGKIAHFIVATGDAVDMLLKIAGEDPSATVQIEALYALQKYGGRAYLRRIDIENIGKQATDARIRNAAENCLKALDNLKAEETTDLAAFEFQKQFNHELVCNEEAKSKYDIFVDLCRARLPVDADSRYQRLRTSGFIMKDDADIDVYTVRVAGRHVAKFAWFYKLLFSVFKREMTSRVDIVVWGCGCGLDLLALYDQAMRQDNPDFWLVVNSVTLIDVSAAALKRAKRIAEVLFPSARGRVITHQCDLRIVNQYSQLELPKSFPFRPRVHLLSNLIDLFDDVSSFAKTVYRLARREYREKDEKHFAVNDIYFAFSPEYRVGRVAENLRAFRAEWGASAKDVQLPSDLPENFKCVAFSCCTFSLHVAYEKYLSCNQAIRQYAESIAECGENNWSHELNTLDNIAKLSIAGLPCVERYSCARKVSLFSGNAIVLFAPKEDRLKASIIVEPSDKSKRMSAIQVARDYLNFQIQNGDPGALVAINRDLDGRERGRRIVEQALERGPILPQELARAKKAENEEIKKAIEAEVRLLDCFNIWVTQSDQYDGFQWLEGQGKDATWGTHESVDFLSAFLPDVHNTEPLPLPKGEQRHLVYGRKQLRKVRGGPGTGKTLTMLWHAVMSFERTSCPVLVLCKTHSLIEKNRCRLMATYIKKHKNIRCYEEDKIDFRTLDSYLCDILKKNGMCAMSMCGNCRSNCIRARSDVAQKITDERCLRDSEHVFRLLSCAGHMGVPPDFDMPKKDEICEWCKKRAHNMLRDDARYSFENLNVGTYAAVLVDEAQILDMSDVKLVYQMTGAVNPWREFYIFFDEEQSCRGNTLISEDGFKTVPAPATGFGSPITLKTQLRLVSSALLPVFQKVQQQLIGYAPIEMVLPLANADMTQGELPIGVPFEIKKVNGILSFDYVKKEVLDFQGNNGNKTCLVLVDRVQTLKSLANDANENGWVLTHLTARNRDRENKLRDAFREQEGKIHLTSIDCSQGQTFRNVLLFVTQPIGQNIPGSVEGFFTAITRASTALRIVDLTSQHCVYDLLKEFNPR